MLLRGVANSGVVNDGHSVFIPRVRRAADGTGRLLLRIDCSPRE